MLGSLKNYVFHPVILDACFHWTLHPAILQNTELGVVFLPSKARKFTFYRSPNPDESVYSHLVLKKWTPGAYRSIKESLAYL
jgi:Polyketide synthase dehydratase